MLVCPHCRGIHHQFTRSGKMFCLKLLPTTEALVYRMPIADLWRQITARTTCRIQIKNRFHGSRDHSLVRVEIVYHDIQALAGILAHDLIHESNELHRSAVQNPTTIHPASRPPSSLNPAAFRVMDPHADPTETHKSLAISLAYCPKAGGRKLTFGLGFTRVVPGVPLPSVPITAPSSPSPGRSKSGVRPENAPTAAWPRTPSRGSPRYTWTTKEP